MTQKLPCKDFEYTATTSLDNEYTMLRQILNISDDSDHGYYIVCDFKYTNSCKDRTEQLALMSNKRKINDNRSGYRETEKGRAGTEKLVLDLNKKKQNMCFIREW